MKIENRGVYITEVRGLDGIEVESTGLVRVAFTGLGEVTYRAEWLGALIEALQAAHREALAIEGTPVHQPRVFTEETGIPDEVAEVSDRDGALWERVAVDRWTLRGTRDPVHERRRAEFLLGFAPLTEVLG